MFDNVEKIDALVRDLELLIPKSGGLISIGSPPWYSPTTTVFIGDHEAFLRLGVILIRYALDAKFPEGHTNAPAVIMNDYFLPLSETTSLILSCNAISPNIKKTTIFTYFTKMMKNWLFVDPKVKQQRNQRSISL